MAVVRIYKKYSFHNCRLFPFPHKIIDILSYIKDFILFVSLCTLIVNCVSLYQVSPAQIWVASWTYVFSGHQPDEPTVNKILRYD